MFLTPNSKRINIKMVAKVLGWLLMIESAFMTIPALVAICYGESDYRTFFICAAVTFVCGYAMHHFLRPERRIMAKRECFLLTALVWLVFSLFGMLPFIFGQDKLNVGDAFFEAMSGFTTTGCSAYPNPEILTHGINIWRVLMQWIGGMGIIIFTLAVIPMLNTSSGMQMFNAEVTGITHEKIRPHVSQTAKSLWVVYIALSILCAFLLWIGPMDFFDSVCHALGTISAGGFTTRPDGPASWNSIYVDVVITIFMFLGGTSFSLIFFTVTGRFFKVRRNSTFLTYTGIILGSLVIFSIVSTLSTHRFSVRNLLIDPLFQIVSTATSSGYVMPNLTSWAPIMLGLLIPLMFFGGCAGSTSGGAKIDRLLVLLKFTKNSVKRSLLPYSVTSIEIDGHVLPKDTVSKVIAFFCWYGIIICVSALVLCAMGIDSFDSFYAALSCITNTGISPADMGGSVSITSFPLAGKMLLAFIMLTGRLEIYTILILLIPSFWNK